MLENSIDAVSLRLAVGVLGLILLLCYCVAPRRRSRHVLPDGFVPTVAVSLFGAAGAGLAVLAASGGPAISVVGPGWYLSGALVALVMAATLCAPAEPHAAAASPWLSFLTARNEPPAGGRPAARDPPRAPRAGPGHPGR